MTWSGRRCLQGHVQSKEALIDSFTPLSRFRGERSEGGDAGLNFMMELINQAFPNL